MTNIIGISAYYHDSAACLLKDGALIAAAQEERFTRRRHDAAFPAQALKYCLKQGGVRAEDIDHLVYYEKPFLKFERLLETYLNYAPRGLGSFIKAMPVWLKEKLFLSAVLNKEMNRALGLECKMRVNWEKKLLFPEHHHAHAASAFFPSPFESAAVLTVDGVGEWATTTLAHGQGNRLDLTHEIGFPHSLGLLYSSFTYYTGFRVNSGEYKVMGLAPYGKPIYVQKIFDHLIDVKPDGSFRLNMDYFNYCTGLTMTNERFHDLFGGPPRRPESRLTQKEMDLAASVQKVVEDVMIRLARFAKEATGEENLCLAGGVALNCVANGKILKEGLFKRIWVQPAAGDAGGAVGAAYAAWHQYLGKARGPLPAGLKDFMSGSYLGPEYTNEDIESYLKSNSIPYVRLPPDELAPKVAALLAEGRVIGFFQGRMEFGPRALGARSIIGDARNPQMQSVLNLKIKQRESFRPFAPSVPFDRMPEYFDLTHESPYMLLVAPVKESHRLPAPPEADKLWGLDLLHLQRSDIPAVTHLDYSARVQSVHSETNPRYHALIEEFGRITGHPVIVNTSFNVRGEPIVLTPEDAFRCFRRTGMDYLVLGDFLLDKSQQEEWKDDTDWKQSFALD